jgi:O-antigen/teichoic acid export membrane protein
MWSYGGGALLAIALTVPIGRYFGVPDGIVALAALNGAFLGLFNFVNAFFQVRQEWGPRARVILRQALLRGPATLAGLALGSATTGAIGAVVGAGLGLLLALRDPVLLPLRGRSWTRTGVGDAARTWSQSRWFTILTAAASGAQYLPIAWVSRVAGSDALASFGLASQLAAGPALVLLSVLIYQQPTGSDPAVSLNDYARLAKRSIAPVLVLFVIAAIGAPFLIPAIFGAEFESAVVPFELLLIGTGVLTLASPLDILNLRLRNPRAWAAMDIVRVVVLIVGLIALPSMFPVPVAAGAAVATSAVVSRVVGLAGLLKVRHRLQDAPERVEI